MGNPATQPRTNAPKPNPKPKHRHSGSVSSISFTPEDLKPKHRHSGSFSGISLTPEDLKPRHRNGGPVSNISLPPEDQKPKHRRSGSVSNISIAPDDVKPRHRHCGSVSSISITSEDFSSPTRGDIRSPSSVSSISSSASLKEKRLKRHTRSSLGGTEDFIKELDFLTPSSNGRTPDSGARKELLKAAPSPLFSESATLQAASEALAPVPEISLPAHINGTGTLVPVEQADELVIEKADVGEIGGSHHDDNLNSLVEGSVQNGDAVPPAERKCNGHTTVSTSTVDVNGDEHFQEVNDVGKHECQGNGHLPSTTAATPVVGTLTEENCSAEPAEEQNEAQEIPESVAENGPPPESLVSSATSATVPTITSENQEVSNTDNGEVSATGGIVSSSTANGDSQTASTKLELPQHEQGVRDMQEEKVSVQKRIEQLERIAGGRPVHFRSQSLSLPRPFDISHARHHEAEGSRGLKMPAYRAPLDCSFVSEIGCSQMVGPYQDEEIHQECLLSEWKALAESTSPVDPAGCEIAAQVTEAQKVFDKEGERSESQRVNVSSGEISDTPESRVEAVLSETPEVVKVSPESMMNGTHLPNGTTAELSKSLPAEKGESTPLFEPLSDSKADATSVEQNVAEQGKEDGAERGLGGVCVIVPAVSGPEELPALLKENHLAAAADQTRENAGKVENSKAGAFVESSPEALQVGSVLQAHEPGTLPTPARAGMLPIAHQRGTLPDPVSVQANMAEQSSQDYETSMLLTKQPAVDPLFVDSQQDRLWEMHSQELTIEEPSGSEVRESSAQDDESRPYANGTPSHIEVSPAGSAPNRNGQPDKSGKVDRPRTPLRSLLAEEDAEKGPDSGPLGTPPQHRSASPKGNLFKRIVSGGKNSPTKQTTPTKFSPKNQPTAKPFLSSCICCSVK